MKNEPHTGPSTAVLEATGWEGFIPKELWGRDHKTTLLYAETRAVDHGGILDSRHMRSGPDASWKYPTRLSDGNVAMGHDDYDCIRDAEHAGLLHFSNQKIEFTDEGWAYVHGLRRARAEGS